MCSTFNSNLCTQLSLATVLPMSVMKWALLPSMMSYLTFPNTFQNIMTSDNMNAQVKTTHYDWSSLTNNGIRNKYMINVRNNFDSLQRHLKHTSNEEYENFLNAHIKVLADCLPTKSRSTCQVPWESKAVREKWDNMKKASLLNKRNPTNVNAEKLKKVQREVTDTYQKEQLEYIQGQINKIRNSVEDRQSRIAWQTVNQVSSRKSTLVAANQE